MNYNFEANNISQESINQQIEIEARKLGTTMQEIKKAIDLEGGLGVLKTRLEQRPIFNTENDKSLNEAARIITTNDHILESKEKERFILCIMVALFGTFALMQAGSMVNIFVEGKELNNPSENILVELIALFGLYFFGNKSYKYSDFIEYYKNKSGKEALIIKAVGAEPKYKD